MREELYPIEEVCLAIGLEESKIRFLEKEFGGIFQFTEFSPIKKYFNSRQVSALQHISYLWQEKGQSIEAIKSQLHSTYAHKNKGAWIIAVTSGKGGVGKTSIATNLSIALAQKELKTIVFDADLGLANAHVLMGISPKYGLHDLLTKDVGIDDIIAEGPAGSKLIPGGSGFFDLAEIDDHQRDFVIHEIKKISSTADVVIIDTAAGISANVMRFLALADDVIVTATPSITSLLDAYGVIKTMYTEQIKVPVNLLVNMVRSQREAREIYGKIEQCTRQFLDWNVNYLGCIKKDLNVDRAIQLCKPLIIAYPNSPASKHIRTVADRLAEKVASKKQEKKQDNFSNIFFKERN